MKKIFLILSLILIINITACFRKISSNNMITNPSTNTETITNLFPLIEGIKETKWEQITLENINNSIAAPTDYTYQGYIVIDENTSNKYFSLYKWEYSNPNILFETIEIPEGEWMYSYNFCKDMIPEYYTGTMWFNGNTILFSVSTT